MFDSQTVRREGSEDEDEANRERTNRGQLRFLSKQFTNEQDSLSLRSSKKN